MYLPFFFACLRSRLLESGVQFKTLSLRFVVAYGVLDLRDGGLQG